jgi:hypothetical protein
MPRTTLLTYVNNLKRSEGVLTVTLPNGDTIEGMVLSFNNTKGLETLTIGYGGMASELRQRDEAFSALWTCKQCSVKQFAPQLGGEEICDECVARNEWKKQRRKKRGGAT